MDNYSRQSRDKWLIINDQTRIDNPLIKMACLDYFQLLSFSKFIFFAIHHKTDCFFARRHENNMPS